MYSETRFHSAKAALAYSILHNPDDHADKVESAFLRSLLSAAAEQGAISLKDVQRAIDKSGVMELDVEIADRLIRRFCVIGDQYAGRLSPLQARELRNLRKLCQLVVEHNDAEALSQIAELL
jgi:hypothetical protein